MKKTFTLIIAAVFAVNMYAQDGAKKDSINIGGDYADLLENGSEESVFGGSFYDSAPTTFYLKHTGAQMIYKKDELAAASGKEITALKYLYYNSNTIGEYPRDIKVYIQEIDDEEFVYDTHAKDYKFFDHAATASASFSYDHDFSEEYGMNGEFILNLSTPFKYSGEKNLLVTVTCDGEDATDSRYDLEFFASDLKKRSCLFCDDKYSYADYEETEDYPYVGLGHGTAFELPVTQVVFQDEASTDGISNVKLSTSNSQRFNLAGQKVSNSFKGIVISNGKKHIVK